MLKRVNFIDESFDKQYNTLLWRNSECVSKYFLIKSINPEVHIKWLESLHESKPVNIAFFINYKNEDVGVTYFKHINYNNKIADWGIYIYKIEARNKGIGSIVLKNCIKYAKDELNLDELYLDVLSSNHRAIKLYENMGFCVLSKNNNVIRYRKNLKGRSYDN